MSEKSNSAVIEAPETTYTTIKQGQWVEMRDDERWYKCSDVNQRLHRGCTRIGVALADAEYQDNDGCKNAEIATFTFRQFYRDHTRPTLDYTESSLRKWLQGIAMYQGKDRADAIVKILQPALKRFEHDYKAYGAEDEALQEYEHSKQLVF